LVAGRQRRPEKRYRFLNTLDEVQHAERISAKEGSWRWLAKPESFRPSRDRRRFRVDKFFANPSRESRQVVLSFFNAQGLEFAVSIGSESVDRVCTELQQAAKKSAPSARALHLSDDEAYAAFKRCFGASQGEAFCRKCECVKLYEHKPSKLG
jgi:hypothetical protein